MTLCKPSKISVCNIKCWYKGAEMTIKKTEKILTMVVLQKTHVGKVVYTSACVHRHRFLAKNLSAKCCLNENEYWGLGAVTIRNFSFIHSANIYLVLCCAGNMVLKTWSFFLGVYTPGRI